MLYFLRLSKVHLSRGWPATARRGLGILSVNGLNLVPSPPAKITAVFIILDIMAIFKYYSIKGNFMYKTKDFEINIPKVAPIKTFKEEDVILVEGQEARRTLKEEDSYNKVEEVWKRQKGDYSEAKVRLDYSKINVNGQLVLGVALTI